MTNTNLPAVCALLAVSLIGCDDANGPEQPLNMQAGTYVVTSWRIGGEDWHAAGLGIHLELQSDSTLRFEAVDTTLGRANAHYASGSGQWSVIGNRLELACCSHINREDVLALSNMQFRRRDAELVGEGRVWGEEFIVSLRRDDDAMPLTLVFPDSVELISPALPPATPLHEYPDPVVIRVFDGYGMPMANYPVYAESVGNSQVRSSDTQAWSGVAETATDASGYASVLVRAGFNEGIGRVGVSPRSGLGITVEFTVSN